MWNTVVESFTCVESPCALPPKSVAINCIEIKDIAVLFRNNMRI